MHVKKFIHDSQEGRNSIWKVAQLGLGFNEFSAGHSAPFKILMYHLFSINDSFFNNESQ